MNFYKLQILSLFAALLTFGESAPVVWESGTINNVVAGQTATEMVLKFTTGTVLTSSQKFVIVASRAVWADGTITSNCDVNGMTSNRPTCVTSNSGDTLTVTEAGADVSAGAIVITITANIAANTNSEDAVTFVVTPSSADTANAAGTGWTLFQKPRIYYLKSECRAGGNPLGQLSTCEEGTGHCKTCTGTHAFVTVSGLQNSITDDCVSPDHASPAANTQFRCDALYYTDSSLDIAVSTKNHFGLLTCGAWTDTDNAPTISLENALLANLKSSNSVYVHEADKSKDQLITLFNLESDKQYDIYCHMDNGVMSPNLRVWTDVNDRITDDSLVPSVLTQNVDPQTLTLTFTHGLDLGTSDQIKLTTSTARFSGAPVCEVWAKPVGGQFTKHTTQPSDEAWDNTNKVLTFTLGVASTKGNTLKIVCNTNLAVNPAAVVVTYSLEVAKHPVTLEKRYGYTTVAPS